MASFEKVGKRWKAVIRRTGQPKKTRTFDTKREAAAWAREYEYALDNNMTDATLSSLTYAMLLRRYIAEETIKKKSARSERLRLERFMREHKKFASKPLDKLNPRDVVAWRDARLNNVSPDTVNREWNTLSAVLTCAHKKWGLPVQNIFALVQRPDSAKPRHQRIAENDTDEIIAALGYSRGAPVETQRQAVAWCFLFAIATAMRASEILSLTPDSIRGRIAHLADTKNGEPRNVPLSSHARDLLDLLPNGLPVGITSAYLDATYRRYRPAHLSHIRFHDTRHEALSQMAKKIPNPMDLAKISGHKKLDILLNVYYNPDNTHLADLLD